MTKKVNKAVAIVVIVGICAVVIVVSLFFAPGSGYKDKIVPKNPPKRVHHPWMSKPGK